MPAPLQSYRVRDWFALDGDHNLRLDYDLTQDSIVLDVGGFEGEFAYAIHEKYGCNVYIFEPHPGYLATLVDRFLDHPKIKIFPYGLSDKSGVEIFSSAGDATSFFNKGESSFHAQLKAADEAFKELGLTSVDLLKLNIEGAEYGVLKNLSQSGLIPQIKNIQVQFHDFFDDSAKRVKEARSALIATHAPTYMFSFVWENWKRIDNDTDAESRRALFLSMDHIRERLSHREQQIDQMNEDAQVMREQIERLASRVEGNTIELQIIRHQTRAFRFLATVPQRMRDKFKR